MRGMQWSIEVEKTMRQIARSDGKRETGDPGEERGRREETEMDDKADVRGEREIGERHPAEVVSMDIPVSFVLAFIVPSRTLRTLRDGAKERLRESGGEFHATGMRNTREGCHEQRDASLNVSRHVEGWLRESEAHRPK